MSGSMPISTQPSLVKARSRVDRLINLDDFYTHVRHCRWAFGVGLAVASVGQVLRMPDMVLIWGVLSPAKWRKGWWMVEGATWMAGTVLLAVAAVTFLFSLRSSLVPRPCQITEEEESTVSERTPLLPPNTSSPPEPPLLAFDSFRRYSRHITILFFISFLALSIRPLPSMIYVLRTHRAPPHLTFSAHSRQSLLRIIGNIGNWAMFLSVGMMRRGPEMRYDPPKVGTGFGLTAGVYDAQKGDDQGDKEAVSCHAEYAAVKVAGKAREVPNVFDYDGCCLFSFIFVGYALHIGVLSGRKNKLDISDLPHLTYAQRAENIVLPLEGRVFVPEAHTSTFQPTSSAGGRSSLESQKRGGVMNVGSWELAKLLWRGKGSIIMTNIILEWAKVVAEHVKLHLPVRSMLNISLFSKILHSVDAKSAEAERGTEEDGNSQGRAQVSGELSLAILNLLLIDGKRVGELGLRAFSISNAFLSVVIGVVFLYMMFGWTAFVGMAVIPLAAPFSYWISVYRYRVDRDLSRAQDARVSAINEFLLSVKVIKLNAWDEHFIKRISVLRDREIRLQRKRFHIGTGFNVLSDQLPLCAILVIFFTYTKIMGQTLEPATAFVAMAVFGKVKAAISIVPDVISALLLARISLGRLGCYFSKPEVAALGQGTSITGQIRLKQATVAWPTSDAKKDQIDTLTEQTDFKLQNMTVDIPQNALTLISGPLGSGKTLFLLALLGEARLLSGEIEAPRSDPDALPLPEDQVDVELTLDAWLDPSMTAYSSQISYIKHGDIRDNILNGLPMWHERYAAVLRQCALIPDLKLFDHADLTEVGEQGVTLVSQGKIGAKTIYLDDILSAVDAHTARHLYQHCLKGDLLKNRTVVLVSHNVNLVLPSAQYVVHVENGVIEKSGPAKDFSVSEVDVNVEDGDLSLLLDPVDPVELDTVSSAAIPTEIRRIYEEEKREIGQVDRRNYAFLFKCAGGAIYWSIFALIYGGTEFFNFLQTLWLKYWTSDGRPERLGHYLTGYAIIVTLGILTGAFRWVWLYGIRLGNVRVGFTDSAAPKIHEMMLRRLVGSPLALFNSWPTGRLLNRFSGDIWQIDGSISDDVGRSISAGKEIFL
ncbi:hypothetical protein QFC22_004633 [Naganishia vaughanmartiniae]|uniref:Uncharacterized protein n=1 Tax=Naganishia vaughanmartiniae TaxID=1424756 RepID=A0ACC2X075_9TREE|nr:hypothetical protein QFC22_004633 [Naganishia vaughanmartiniae]